MVDMMSGGQVRQEIDQRALKACIRQMNRALRDSHDGGLMERFETVSKLLFTKIVDEREIAGTWYEASSKTKPAFAWRPDDTERSVYERTRALWRGIVESFPDVFTGTRGHFTEDVAAVARCAQVLAGINLSTTPADIKGGVYEELLRNTFEKNENQQYFTPRHIASFMVDICAPQRTDAVCDPAAGSAGLLVSALVYVLQHGDDITSFAKAMRGAEIDERMAWIARINMLMHGGEPHAIFHLIGAGSLAPLPQLQAALPRRSFDLILTNPPFGSDMNDREALRLFRTGKNRTSRRRGVLFVERCMQLLKPGGRLAIVLDDSVLNQAKNDDVRQLIRRDNIVEAVISLPDVTFMPYSTAKSSILVLRRKRSVAEVQGPVFMADVENVGNRPNGDPLYDDTFDENGHRRLKSDLPAVAALYRRFMSGEMIDASFEGTAVFAVDIDAYTHEGDGSRLDAFFFHPARWLAQYRLSQSRYPLASLGTLVALDTAAVVPADEYPGDSVRWIGLGDIEALTGHYDVRDVAGDSIKSSAHLFRGGGILFSRLRPRLRKATYVPLDDEGGICSSELLVLRVRPDVKDKVLPEYLAYLLRSDLVYGQLIYRITGVGRPRVSSDAVMRISLPLPPMEIQRDLVDALARADRRARELRNEALRHADQATREMEEAYVSVVGSLVPDASPGKVSSPVSADAVSLRPLAARATASA